MVEGTGLENQRRKRPQVRILSFPPSLFRDKQERRSLSGGLSKNKKIELALIFYFY